MKRAAFFLLFLFGILTVASDFFSLMSEATWAGRLHVGIGVVFVLLIIGHVRHSVKTSRRAPKTARTTA